MKIKTLLVLCLLPLLTLSQITFYEKGEVRKISEEEHETSYALNKVEGLGDFYFIINEQKYAITEWGYSFRFNYKLLNSEGRYITLTNYSHNQSKLVYYELLKDEFFLIEELIGRRKRVRISKYNIDNGKLVKQLIVDVPCKFGVECDWINYIDKKLAFYNNFLGSEDLQDNAIYEYDWRTEDIKMIYDKLPLAIDAVTGRNFELLNVGYDKDAGRFKYGQ